MQKTARCKQAAIALRVIVIISILLLGFIFARALFVKEARVNNMSSTQVLVDIYDAFLISAMTKTFAQDPYCFGGIFREYEQIDIASFIPKGEVFSPLEDRLIWVYKCFPLRCHRRGRVLTVDVVPTTEEVVHFTIISRVFWDNVDTVRINVSREATNN